MLTVEEYNRQRDRVLRWKTMEPDEVLEDMTPEERKVCVQVELSEALAELSGLLYMVTHDDRYLGLLDKSLDYYRAIAGEEGVREQWLDDAKRLLGHFDVEPGVGADLIREFGQLMASYPGDEQPDDVDGEQGA